MRKMLLLSLAIVLGTLSMSAQKSGMWVGGSLGVYHTSGGTAWSIMPEVGTKLNDKFDLGIVLGYSKDFSSFNGDITTTTNMTTFKINPYLRYNVLEGKVVGLFLDGTVGYNNSKTDGADGSTNGFQAGIQPGVKVKVNDRFCFISHFGFLGYSKVGDTSVYGFGLDMSKPTLGLVYTF